MGRKKFTYQEVKEYLESFDYELLSEEYINKDSKLKMRCPEGHEIEMSFGSFKNSKHRCRYCSNSNIKYTYEYVKEYIENEGYELLSTDYKNNKSKIKIKCPNGHISEVRFDVFKRGHRCGICANNVTFSQNEVSSFLENEGYKLLSDYKNINEKIKLECPNGHIYEQRFGDFKNGHRCPQCANVYKGEKKIEEILNKLNIKYIQQYTYKDCKNSKKLRFDFYLSEYNILIEYDGVQHFKPVKRFRGEIGFAETIYNDATKNSYCEDNNIKLIRIPYWEFNNIENILKNNLTI